MVFNLFGQSGVKATEEQLLSSMDPLVGRLFTTRVLSRSLIFNTLMNVGFDAYVTGAASPTSPVPSLSPPSRKDTYTTARHNIHTNVDITAVTSGRGDRASLTGVILHNGIDNGAAGFFTAPTGGSDPSFRIATINHEQQRTVTDYMLVGQEVIEAVQADIEQAADTVLYGPLH